MLSNVASNETASLSGDQDGAASILPFGPGSLHAGASAPANAPVSIAFVDTAVAGWQDLAAGIGGGVEIVLIPQTDDPLAFMADALAAHGTVDSVHILSHGGSGFIEIGGHVIDGEVLASQASVMSAWSGALSKGADILLYGCNTGGGAAGQSFIDAFASATHADVAASNDLTGASAHGGDWLLEAHSGTIETAALDLSDSEFAGELNASFAPTSTAISSQTYTGTDNNKYAGSAVLFDADKDGDLDMLAVREGNSQIFKNDGDGNFSSFSSFANGRGSHASAADIDKDGDNDLIVYSLDQRIQVFNNDGAGHFSIGSLLGDSGNVTNNDVYASGDVDNDGDIDIIAGIVGGSKVYLNDSHGVFTEASTITNTLFANSGGLFGMALIDFDRDGKLDLAIDADTSLPGEASTTLFKGNGLGGFTSMGTIGGSAYSSGIFAADFNNDGFVDLYQNGDSLTTNRIYLNNGTFTPTGSANNPIDAQFRPFNATDIDKDGDLDFAFEHYDSGTSTTSVGFYINNGSGSFTPDTETFDHQASVAHQGTPRVLTTGDIDGDGDKDAVVVREFYSYGYDSGSHQYIYTDDFTIAWYANQATPATAPEIAIRGNGVEIADGDTTPSALDDTVFGITSVPGGTVSKTFTIQNTGDAALTVGAITVSGANAADFTVTANPASSVGVAGSTTFTVTFDPSASGTRTATISVANGDADEGTYDFSVSGTANTAPTVSGDGTESAATIVEDTPSAVGQTVAALFGGQFSDAADQAAGGAGANAFAGVAIVANGSGADGQWQYFDGAAWVDIGPATAASAQLLTAATAIRFNPAQDFNGAAPTLTVHLVETSGTAFANGDDVDLSAGGATGGSTHYSSGTVVLGQDVTAVDDLAIAVDDTFFTDEATVLAGNLFAANGTTPDSDPDGDAFVVTNVNGVAANVGVQIALASGALLTVDADGGFSYDPNGRFDALPDASASGASNGTFPDSFSYTITGGGTATVSIGVDGLDGVDTLLGTAGADFLFGGILDDTLVGSLGADQMQGGSGFDTADYSGSTDAVSVDLGANTGSGGDAAGDGFASIEGLIGSALADSLTGDGGANHINGFKGDDTMAGGAGDDIMWVNSAGDVIVEAVGGGFDIVAVNVDYQLAAGVEVEDLRTTSANGTLALHLTGNEFQNSLTGNAGDNVLDGRGDADTMRGSFGNDLYYVDNAGDVVIEQDNGGTDTVAARVSYTLAAGTYVELLRTSSMNATLAIDLTGNAFANRLTGNAGANTLNGGGGADTLIGWTGADALNGGSGVDTASYAGASAGVIASLANTTINTGDAAGDRYNSIENLTGSSFGDALNGTNTRNVINGGAGNDTIKGYAGNDTLTGGAGADIFVFNTALDAAANVDAITDFSVADDSLWLDNAIFSALPTGALAAAAFHIGTAAADALERIIYDSGTGALSYDADGTGAAAAIRFATIGTGLALTNDDFQVI